MECWSGILRCKSCCSQCGGDAADGEWNEDYGDPEVQQLKPNVVSVRDNSTWSRVTSWVQKLRIHHSSRGSVDGKSTSVLTLARTRTFSDNSLQRYHNDSCFTTPVHLSAFCDQAYPWAEPFQRQDPAVTNDLFFLALHHRKRSLHPKFYPRSLCIINANSADCSNYNLELIKSLSDPLLLDSCHQEIYDCDNKAIFRELSNLQKYPGSQSHQSCEADASLDSVLYPSGSQSYFHLKEKVRNKISSLWDATKTYTNLLPRKPPKLTADAIPDGGVFAETTSLDPSRKNDKSQQLSSSSVVVIQQKNCVKSYSVKQGELQLLGRSVDNNLHCTSVTAKSRDINLYGVVDSEDNKLINNLREKETYAEDDLESVQYVKQPGSFVDESGKNATVCQIFNADLVSTGETSIAEDPSHLSKENLECNRSLSLGSNKSSASSASRGKEAAIATWKQLQGTVGSFTSKVKQKYYKNRRTTSDSISDSDGNQLLIKYPYPSYSQTTDKSGPDTLSPENVQSYDIPYNNDRNQEFAGPQEHRKPHIVLQHSQLVDEAPQQMSRRRPSGDVSGDSAEEPLSKYHKTYKEEFCHSESIHSPAKRTDLQWHFGEDNDNDNCLISEPTSDYERCAKDLQASRREFIHNMVHIAPDNGEISDKEKFKIHDSFDSVPVEKGIKLIPSCLYGQENYHKKDDLSYCCQEERQNKYDPSSFIGYGKYEQCYRTPEDKQRKYDQSSYSHGDEQRECDASFHGKKEVPKIFDQSLQGQKDEHKHYGQSVCAHIDTSCCCVKREQGHAVVSIPVSLLTNEPEGKVVERSDSLLSGCVPSGKSQKLEGKHRLSSAKYSFSDKKDTVQHTLSSDRRLDHSSDISVESDISISLVDSEGAETCHTFIENIPNEYEYILSANISRSHTYVGHFPIENLRCDTENTVIDNLDETAIENKDIYMKEIKNVPHFTSELKIDILGNVPNIKTSDINNCEQNSADADSSEISQMKESSNYIVRNSNQPLANDIVLTCSISSESDKSDFSKDASTVNKVTDGHSLTFTELATNKGDSPVTDFLRSDEESDSNADHKGIISPQVSKPTSQESDTVESYKLSDTELTSDICFSVTGVLHREDCDSSIDQKDTRSPQVSSHASLTDDCELKISQTVMTICEEKEFSDQFNLEAKGDSSLVCVLPKSEIQPKIYVTPAGCCDSTESENYSIHDKQNEISYAERAMSVTDSSQFNMVLPTKSIESQQGSSTIFSEMDKLWSVEPSIWTPSTITNSPFGNEHRPTTPKSPITVQEWVDSLPVPAENKDDDQYDVDWRDDDNSNYAIDERPPPIFAKRRLTGDSIPDEALLLGDEAAALNLKPSSSAISKDDDNVPPLSFVTPPAEPKRPPPLTLTDIHDAMNKEDSGVIVTWHGETDGKRLQFAQTRDLQTSFQSETSNISCLSHQTTVSSIESLLESRQVDPVDILLNLGFGGGCEDEGLSRIPPRFLKPSKVPGNDINVFLQQEDNISDLVDSSEWVVPGISAQGGWASTPHLVYPQFGGVSTKSSPRHYSKIRTVSGGLVPVSLGGSSYSGSSYVSPHSPRSTPLWVFSPLIVQSLPPLERSHCFSLTQHSSQAASVWSAPAYYHHRRSQHYRSAPSHQFQQYLTVKDIVSPMSDQ